MTDHILVPRAVLQAAEECLNRYMSSYGFDSDLIMQLKKFRALLDEPCEPVAVVGKTAYPVYHQMGDQNWTAPVGSKTVVYFKEVPIGTPLYAPKEQL